MALHNTYHKGYFGIAIGTSFACRGYAPESAPLRGANQRRLLMSVLRKITDISKSRSLDIIMDRARQSPYSLEPI